MGAVERSYEANLIDFLSRVKGIQTIAYAIREKALILDEETKGAQQKQLAEMVEELHRTYASYFKGTPEGDYISALCREYVPSESAERSPPMNLAVLDRKIEEFELVLPQRVCTRLNMLGIRYIGQLVQQSEDELRDIRFNSTRRGNGTILFKIRQLLDIFGLQLGMNINYLPPEEREMGGTVRD